MFNPTFAENKGIGGILGPGGFAGSAFILNKVFQSLFCLDCPYSIFRSNVSMGGLAGDRIVFRQHNKLPAVSRALIPAVDVLFPVIFH